MPEFGIDFDSKNRRNASKKRDDSIHSRQVLKMFKKDDDNASKSECKSNFISKMEKVKKISEKLVWMWKSRYRKWGMVKIRINTKE